MLVFARFDSHILSVLPRGFITVPLQWTSTPNNINTAGHYRATVLCRAGLSVSELIESKVMKEKKMTKKEGLGILTIAKEFSHTVPDFW